MTIVDTDVALLHCCPQSCMPNPVEGPREVYEDMENVLLVLDIFITENSQVEGLLCGGPACCEACLFFSKDLLCLQPNSVRCDIQLDFAWVAYETYRSVVLALLQVAFLAKCYDKGLGPRGWLFSYPPDLVADCRESSGYCFSTCLTSSAGILSTPADFPFFNNCTEACISLLRMGGCPLCLSGDS